MAFFVAPEFDYDGEMTLDTRERLLVAFPHRVPRPERTFILDSGAFAVSKQKTRWPEPQYISRLAAWYAEHYRPGMLCIAPDVYPDGRATMQRYRRYRERFSVPLVPVVQGDDWFDSRRQIRFYAPFRPEAIALSNPGRRYDEYAPLLAWQIECVRRYHGDIHIHSLGAGWTPEEAGQYRSFHGLGSFDTIAYYTQAREVEGWAGNRHWQAAPEPSRCPCAACRAGLADWRYIAMHNAAVYQSVH